MSHILKTTFSPEASEVYLATIKDQDKVHPNFETTKLPFEFTFKAKLPDGTKVDIVEETTGVMMAKNWAKRFYVGEDKDANSVTRFSRYYTLNALLEVFRALGDQQLLDGERKGEFDIDMLLKKPFKAIVVSNKKVEHPFIDWLGTFRLNGVKVYDTVNGVWEDEEPVKKEVEQPVDNSKQVEKALNESDLPF